MPATETKTDPLTLGHILVVTGEVVIEDGEPCRDDIEYRIECPGVSEHCRLWWECDICQPRALPIEPVGAELADQLDRTGEAHGVEHQQINGSWVTKTEQCSLDQADNLHEEADHWDLGPGKYVVEYEFQESDLIIPSRPTPVPA